MNATRMTSRRQFFQNRIPIYQDNPVIFSQEVCLFEPDEWQKDTLIDLANNPKVAIKSGQGVGKTSVEAIGLLWFLTCFPFPRVVATAPTKQQLHDVLWSEVAKWQERSPLLKSLLKWTKTYIYMTGHEKRWFATARTATKPENMQGFHEENMLFIVDEASGVADPIMEAILGTLSGDNNKLLMCGNPTRTSGSFYDAFTRDSEMYITRTVSSLDSKRTNKENIQSLIRKYGENSNVVRVRVKGLFPDQEDDVFIPISLAESAVNNDVDLEESEIKRISIGCDVARFGNDETVIALNVSGKITLQETFRGQRTTFTVGQIIKLYRHITNLYPGYFGQIFVNIDDCGVGGGVTDQLEQIRMDEGLDRLIVVPVNAAASVPDEKAAKEYDDMTTYMWANVRELMRAGAINIPNDNELAAQLCCRKYYFTGKGKIKLESKDTMKKRHVDSPDRADAVALSCYEEKIFSIDNLI